jgi:hypothetical protein
MRRSLLHIVDQTPHREWTRVVRNRREPRNCLQELFERPIFCFAQAIAFDRKESSCLTIAFDGTDSGSASAQSLS